MAISASNFDYRGAILPAPYIRLDGQISGNKLAGWEGLLCVYASAALANPAPRPTGEERPKVVDGEPVLDGNQEPVMEPVVEIPTPTPVGDLWRIRADYVEGESPYVTLYRAAMERIPGSVTA